MKEKVYDQREELHRQELVRRGATSDGYKPTGPRPPYNPPAVPEDPFKAQALERNRPMTVKCGLCDHQWVALYLPMPIDQAADMMKAARCPKGCNAPIFMAKGAE